MILTGQILTKITPALKGAYAEHIAHVLNTVLPSYNMDSADIIEDFLPNLLVECKEFTLFEEGLNYKPERLMVIWPKRFPNAAIANQYAHQPQKLANFVYGGRLGNNTNGDGWSFRGSGPIQGTGKGIIEAFTKFYNAKFGTTYSAYLMAEMMRNKINIVIGVHFACWFFSIAKGLIKYALADDFRTVVNRINGGFTGMDFRTKYYQRCKQIFNA